MAQGPSLSSKGIGEPPRFRALWVYASILVLTVAACRPDFGGSLRARVTDAERDLAEKLVVLVGDGDLEAAKDLMWRSEIEGVPDSIWHQLSAGLRGIDPASMRVVSANLQVEGDDQIRTLVQIYEAQTRDGWRQVRIVSRGGRAAGLHVQRTEDSLVERHAFGNAPFMVEQVTMLLWGLSAWIVAVWSAVRVVRVGVPMKWMWALLSFVMVGRLSLNWTTGESVFDLLTVFAPPIAVMKPDPISPWFFWVGIPVFAMISWRKATKWEGSPRTAQPETAIPARWVVYRSTSDGGSFRLAAYAEKDSAEAHARRLQSAGLDLEYWVADESK